jgi:Zn-dependent protease
MEQTVRAVQLVAVYILPIIFAITLHEAAHGYVARYFGDSTAYLQGRISLNPMRHIDPIGTVVLPIVTLMIAAVSPGSAFLFGWAKPVPVSFGNLRNPKSDMMWVALAGPAMNLLMALVWEAFLKIQLSTHMEEVFFLEMAQGGVRINLMFMLLNLLPILPLDGGRIVVSLLPPKAAFRFAQLEPYGLFILFALVIIPGLFSAPGLLSVVLGPLLAGADGLLQFLFNIPPSIYVS